MGKGRCWGGGGGCWGGGSEGWGGGEVHLRIHLLLDNSQEDLSPTLESCEVCGSAHTPPGNWKRRAEEGGNAGGREGEEGQVKEGGKKQKRRRKAEAGKDLETERDGGSGKGKRGS